MNLENVRKLAELRPDCRERLNKYVVAINSYPDDKVYLSEEVAPLLGMLIELARDGIELELIDRIWVDIFKGSAKFTKSYTTDHLDMGDENFMKFLDIAIHSANPEHSHQVGLTKQRR